MSDEQVAPRRAQGWRDALSSFDGACAKEDFTAAMEFIPALAKQCCGSDERWVLGRFKKATVAQRKWATQLWINVADKTAQRFVGKGIEDGWEPPEWFWDGDPPKAEKAANTVKTGKLNAVEIAALVNVDMGAEAQPSSQLLSQPSPSPDEGEDEDEDAEDENNDTRSLYEEEDEQEDEAEAMPAAPRVEVIRPIPGRASDGDEIAIKGGNKPKALKQSQPLERGVEVKGKLIALPGLAGEIQDYFLRTSPQPSQILSLAPAIAVLGALCSEKIIGPTGPRGLMLVQFLMALAETAAGKNMVAWLAKELLRQVTGGAGMLGPNRFRSGPAIVKFIERRRVSLCVQDEWGGLLRRMGDKRTDTSIQEINDRMREAWGLAPDEPYVTSEGAGLEDDAKAIDGVRLNILGMAVDEDFFAACEGKDIINGFLNRLLILCDDVPLIPKTNFEVGLVPKGLVWDLRKLWQKKYMLGATKGAMEIYEEEKAKLALVPRGRERALIARSAEKLMRLGGKFAASRFDKNVIRTDAEIARAIVHHSDSTLRRGFEKAEAKKALDHHALKLRVIEYIKEVEGAQASLFELKSHFKHNTQIKNALDNVVEELNDAGAIYGPIELKTGGKPKRVFRVAGDARGKNQR